MPSKNKQELLDHPLLDSLLNRGHNHRPHLPYHHQALSLIPLHIPVLGLLNTSRPPTHHTEVILLYHRHRKMVLQ